MPQLAAARQCTNQVRRAKAVYASVAADASSDPDVTGQEAEPDGSAEPEGPHRTYFPVTESRHRCFIAMRDLPWRPYLHGKEQRHKEDILKAYRKEIDSLLSTVLRELQPGDKEYDAARECSTPCRALLEWKRQGLWKVRVVIQGHLEDKEALDGPDFQYSSDVVGMTAVRALFMKPLHEGEAIGQVDLATAFLQADLFPPEMPARYLRLPDPVTG